MAHAASQLKKNRGEVDVNALEDEKEKRRKSRRAASREQKRKSSHSDGTSSPPMFKGETEKERAQFTPPGPGSALEATETTAMQRYFKHVADFEFTISVKGFVTLVCPPPTKPLSLGKGGMVWSRFCGTPAMQAGAQRLRRWALLGQIDGDHTSSYDRSQHIVGTRVYFIIHVKTLATGTRLRRRRINIVPFKPTVPARKSITNTVQQGTNTGGGGGEMV
ncbi:unnamed protein product [Pleuronectes platessa]|uniref:Uncharacterized protein n=1 Tax=Pleuronectes platessa TaxID=8262 RepID=A0A9N7V3R0_PLEPL|nr:unnamed protein product [Pleuronectes platessa]